MRSRNLTKHPSVPKYLRVPLAGTAQIVWNSHPLCAVVLLGALAISSPVQLLSCLWALAVSSALVFLFRLPEELALDGLFTINPALAGIAIPLVFFQNSWEYLPRLLLVSACAAALSLLLTILLRRLTTPRQLSPLGLPYSVTLVLISLCVCLSRGLSAPVPFPAQPFAWDILRFLQAVCNGLAQVIWVEGVSNAPLAGLLVLLGILLVSPIDALVSLYAAVLSTATAVLLGLDGQVISLGLYGYGAVLLSMVLFGRAFRMNLPAFLLISLCCPLSVILTAAARPVFSAFGAPVGAVIWSLLALGAMCLRRVPGLHFRPPAQWTTPERSRIQ